MMHQKKHRRPRPNAGELYLTAQELATLMGTTRMATAYKRHKEIRESIRPGKVSLTIREYCEFEGEDYDQICGFLGKT